MSGRPREFDSEKVIQAAMDAFWSNGYEATSAQNLVDSTGIGRGSLYAAFGSKEKLYHDALANYHAQSITFHQACFDAPGSIKSRLATLLKMGIDIDMSDKERNGCMAIFSSLERSAKDPVVDEMSRNYIKQLEKMFCELFADGQSEGEIAADKNPQDMARSFMCGYFGFRTFGRIVHEREYLDFAAALLLNSIE